MGTKEYTFGKMLFQEEFVSLFDSVAGIEEVMITVAVAYNSELP